MAPRDVAKEGHEALMKDELFVNPGAANKAMIASRRILPVTTQAKINQKMNTGRSKARTRKKESSGREAVAAGSLITR